MGGINQVLKLKEQAEEDIYFARLDRELIEKLHEQATADTASDGCGGDRPKVDAAETRLPATGSTR